MMAAFIVALAAVGSYGLTAAVRRYALSRGIVDIPNSRSSHTQPTPRGGGIAIVVAFLFGVLALTVLGQIDHRTAVALALAGGIAAAIGFWDDHRPLPATTRLAAHFAAAIMALIVLRGMPPLEVFGVVRIGDPWIQIVGALLMVWLLNLYNFMDGIDGIAGIEAVTACIGGAAVALTVGYSAGVVVALLLASATVGFLAWNFPPAKIFMGDAGSGFVGIVFGVMAVDAAIYAPQLIWCWLILLGAFIVDATVTLIRRAMRRERVGQAHRSHAYQHAAQRLNAHRPVTLAFGAINLLWLLPIALLVATASIPGETGLIVAWLPLIALAIFWDAGSGSSGKLKPTIG
jgi:Fuc2NAc and GlcNAc transferase